MAFAFFDPDLIVDRLTTELAELGAAVYEVGVAQDLARARAARSPIAVLVFGERSEASDGRVTDTLGVLIELRDATPDDGQTRLTRLRDLRGLIFAALYGYRPDSDWQPLRYAGGRLFDLGDDPGSRMSWLEYYDTSYVRTMTYRLP